MLDVPSLVIVPVEAVGFEDGLNFRVEWIARPASVPVERRCATDAIRLHTPDFKRTPKNILYPGNKKVRFLQIFLINRKERKECREFLINLRAVFCSAGTFENSPQFQLRGGGQKEKVPEELLSPQSSH
jgi:hypothetical protein